MKIVERSVEFINPPEYEIILDTFNHAARNCYQSLNEGTDNKEAAEKLAARLIKIGHGSPLEMNNITVKIVADRAFMGQITRHRLMSFAIESARYNNYSSGKFGKEIKVIRPKELETSQVPMWLSACNKTEQEYNALIEAGAKPEVARSVLPMCLATTMFVSTNIREWRHVFEMRCDSHAQSDIREVMRNLLDMMYSKYPVFFKDLYEKFLAARTEE